MRSGGKTSAKMQMFVAVAGKIRARQCLRIDWWRKDLNFHPSQSMVTAAIKLSQFVRCDALETETAHWCSPPATHWRKCFTTTATVSGFQEQNMFSRIVLISKVILKKLDLRHPKTLSIEGQLSRFPRGWEKSWINLKTTPSYNKSDLKSSGIWLFFAGQHWWTLENIEDLLVSEEYGLFKLNREVSKITSKWSAGIVWIRLMRELIPSLLFKSRWSRLRHNLEDPRFGFRWGDSAGKTVKPEMVWWIGSPGRRTEAWKRWHFRPKTAPEVQHTKSPLKIVVMVVKTILCNFHGACVVKLWGFVWSKDLLRDWMWHWYFANLCCMKCHARKSVFAPKTLIMQDGFWYFEICMSSTKSTPRNWPGNGYCNQSFKIWIFQPSRGCIISVWWDHAFSVPPVRFSYSCEKFLKTEYLSFLEQRLGWSTKCLVPLGLDKGGYHLDFH